MVALKKKKNHNMLSYFFKSKKHLVLFSVPTDNCEILPKSTVH